MPDNSDFSADQILKEILEETRYSYLRCLSGDAIEDDYRRGYLHAMDDIYRLASFGTESKVVSRKSSSEQ